MIFSLRKLRKRMIFMLQLALLTLVAYYALHLLQEWLSPTLRYKEPTGHSVKVFQSEGIADQRQSLLGQLSQFYWMGE